MMADDNHLVRSSPISSGVIRTQCGSMFASPSAFVMLRNLLAERGLDVSYETVRRWVLKFGPLFSVCSRASPQ